MPLDFSSSSLADTNYANYADFGEALSPELPSHDEYHVADQVSVATGDYTVNSGLSGLDGFLNRSFATGESLLKLWGGVQGLRLQRDQMAVQTAQAQTDIAIARAQNDARAAIEIGKAQTAAQTARAAADAAANGIRTIASGIDMKSAIGLAAVAFVAAKLLKGGKK